MRLLGFFLGSLVSVIVAASSPALAQGFVGGMQGGGFVGGLQGGGHVAGFHGGGHVRDFDGDGRQFGRCRFHDGCFRGFGHHAQGVVFLEPALPFGVFGDPFFNEPRLGRDFSVGGFNEASSHGGFGLLNTGGPSSDGTLLRADEVDPSRDRWIEPGPGECPPYEKLFVRAGQRKPRCADPALGAPR